MAWPENEEHTAQDLLDSDVAAGFEITDKFERFNQMDDMFTRAFWDPEVKSDNTQAFFPVTEWRRPPKVQLDFHSVILRCEMRHGSSAI
jgi:epoxyqueuosine reductase